MLKKILVVEDEWKIRKLIRDFLVKDGHVVVEASDGEEAIQKLGESSYDIIILDIMLPKMDGWSVCREIRKDRHTPVIMLTARTNEADQLFGFELGADEYMVKPFNPKLLVAKVRALLRRTSTIEEGGIITQGGIVIDMKKREVKIDGVVLELTQKEYDLLMFFIENKELALSREKILNSVWGWDYFGDSRTVDTHIKRLRKKIGDKYVQTVRGFGYKFEVKDENKV